MLGAAVFPAQAKPLDIEDMAKYPAVSSVSMSVEGDLLVGIVHNPGSGGEDTAVATWDISDASKLPTDTGLVPHAITPGNDRMRMTFATALSNGKVQVLGRQAWTGQTAGCLEGKSTGNERTFVNKFYMSDLSLNPRDMEEMFSKPGMGTRNAAMEQCLELQASLSRIVSMLPLDDEHVIISRGGLGPTRYFKYNMRTEDEELLFRQKGNYQPTLLDRRTGEVLVTSRVEPDGTGDYDIEYYFLQSDGEFRKSEALNSKASKRFTVDVEGVDDATGKYYVVTDKFSDKAAVHMYDATTDTLESEAVAAHPDFSITSVIFSSRKADFNQVIGIRYGGAVSTPIYFEPTLKAIQEQLEKAYPDRRVQLQDTNEDFSRVLYTVSSSANPPVHYLMTDLKRIHLVGAERPWIDADAMRQTELVYYTARDGLEIPGFLTLPKGWKKGDARLPLVVLPHGGPWSRDSAGWDNSGWPQFLATRGYAVLQPQYRGSTGFGRELWLAGDAEWGQKMQDDKDDGAAWLVSEGIADPNRMAMFGYSYGGFAAMAATVRPNSPYRCAIAGAGVSNLARLGNNWSNNRLQRAVQGRTVTGMDPAANTEKANIPILVYHGDRDVRVPLFHGVDFYNAVKRHQPASKLVVIEDMPHSLPWWPEHHRESLSAIEDYLATTCGMQPNA